MDSLRGQFLEPSGDEDQDWDEGEDDAMIETPPSPVGQDERRLQVRAYNHWASLLGNRNFPRISNLDLQHLGDFAPYSVLLDFAPGIENPAIIFLGEKLAEECGGAEAIMHLSDVPGRSVLSRLTDHYMQILGNQAPVGFEAEFVNQQGNTVLYRGILLPFAEDDQNIGHILGVINWKQLADRKTTQELMLEIDQALQETPAAPREREKRIKPALPPIPAMADQWADGPDQLGVPMLASTDDDDTGGIEWPVPAFGLAGDPPVPPSAPSPARRPKRTAIALAEVPPPVPPEALPEGVAESRPESARAPLELRLEDMAPDEEIAQASGEMIGQIGAGIDAPGFASLIESEEAETGESEEELSAAEWLSSARDLALSAAQSETYAREALYLAIGRAHDMALAAEAAPEKFAPILGPVGGKSGLAATQAERIAVIVRLVFGAEHDRALLSDYAIAIAHALRLRLPTDTLAAYLASAPGGLKGVVGEARRLRRAESGEAFGLSRPAPNALLARRLREIEARSLAEITPEGPEFTLLIARRLDNGEVVMVGEVADDLPLLQRVSRYLLD